MTRRLAFAALLASALTACQLGGETTQFSPPATCSPVGAACSADAGCCSYGCVNALCIANPQPGGVCRTSPDCGYAVDAQGSHSMLCKGGACTILLAGMCRDDRDVCYTDESCCGGTCAGGSGTGQGTCGPNHAPVLELGPDLEVPYHKAVTLRPVTVNDPDGDTLVYGWTLVPPQGSAATLSSATAANPTFTPDVLGVYQVQLVVTDGLATRTKRLSASDSLVITAVNTPPVVNAGPDVAHASRNTLQTLAGTVSDPDGDALTCTWKVTSPTGTTTVLANAVPCSGNVGATFTPPIDLASEGDWIATLEATDGVNTVTDTAVFTCVNDPPVAQAGPDRAGNLPAAGASAIPVIVAGSATDVNGDTSFTYAWSFDQVPTGSHAADAPFAATATVTFVPDVVGRYVLRLRVSDRQDSFTEDTVVVDVDRPVRDLGHDVRAAAYAKGANRIVMVGADPTDSTLGHVWIVNAATGAVEVEAQLPSGIPSLVATNRDATLVAAAASTAFWWGTVTYGTTNAITIDSSFKESLTLPFQLGDIEVAGKRLYLLNGSTSSYVTSYVWTFDTQTPTQQPVQTTAAGTQASVYDAGSSVLMYVSDPTWPRITKYAVNGSGQGNSSLGSTAYGSGNACGDLWAGQSGDALFTACGTVLSTSTFATLATLGSASHVDTALDGRSVAITTGGTQLRNASALYAAGAPDALPLWGYDGNRNQTTAQTAFLSSDGATRYAIVSVNGRHGLVTFP